MAEAGIGVSVASLLPEFSSFTNEVLQAAGLDISLPDWTQSGGKKGIHSEYLGYILTELQYMQRAYPGMEW
jgi:ring-1,2-phenylacetyl-CoA epoxidase subunit PaaC